MHVPFRAHSCLYRDRGKAWVKCMLNLFGKIWSLTIKAPQNHTANKICIRFQSVELNLSKNAKIFKARAWYILFFSLFLAAYTSMNQKMLKIQRKTWCIVYEKCFHIHIAIICAATGLHQCLALLFFLVPIAVITQAMTQMGLTLQRWDSFSGSLDVQLQYSAVYGY